MKVVVWKGGNKKGGQKRVIQEKKSKEDRDLLPADAPRRRASRNEGCTMGTRRKGKD